MPVKIIKAQKIPQSSQPVTVDDELTRFCLYFSQYTLSDARKMPYKRIVQMLRVARQEYGRKMYDLTTAICSPHSKGGPARVLEYFKELSQNG